MTVCRLFFEDFPKRESHSFYSGFIRDLGVIRSWFLRRFFASSSGNHADFSKVFRRTPEGIWKKSGSRPEAGPNTGFEK